MAGEDEEEEQNDDTGGREQRARWGQHVNRGYSSGDCSTGASQSRSRRVDGRMSEEQGEGRGADLHPPCPSAAHLRLPCAKTLPVY